MLDLAAVLREDEAFLREAAGLRFFAAEELLFVRALKRNALPTLRIARFTVLAALVLRFAVLLFAAGLRFAVDLFAVEDLAVEDLAEVDLLDFVLVAINTPYV